MTGHEHHEDPAPEEHAHSTEGEGAGPTFLERLNLIAIVAAIVLLAGALGLRAGLFESSPASASFGQEADAAYAGGCGPGGCPSGAGASTGGCGGPGGGCGSGSGPVDIKALERSVAEAYARATGEEGFQVSVKDFGCHQEAEIIKDGKTVKRLAISGGRLYEAD